VSPGDVVALGPALGQIPQRPPRAEGVRVVTRENGRYFDLMPSTLSSYLLPPLADCSLVRREARSAAGSLRFFGNSVELEEISDVLRSDLRTYFTGIAAGLVGVAVGQAAFEVISRLGPLGRTKLEATTAPFTTIDAPNADLVATLAAPDHLAAPALQSSVQSATANPLAPDASVADVATRIAALSDLSDELLADLFKVERETFCRWRTGVLTNPRVGNRRRLGLLLGLLEDLAGREVNIKDWLLNSTSTPQGLTPYQLLEQGRIDEVAFRGASLGEPSVARDPRVAVGHEPEPLVFGDDDIWEPEPLDDDEK
jgi:hypothetical protein